MPFLSPIFNDQQVDLNGEPLSGGKICSYLAGSTTPTATFTDRTGLTQQANPIVLNSMGRPASAIWLGDVVVKLRLTDADGVLISEVDNITGTNNIATSSSEWVDSGFVPTYISATSFSVPGDQTGVLEPKRRLRTQNTAGLVYSSITTSSFSGGLTTVVVANSAGVLDAGLSRVAYGLLSATNPSIPLPITGANFYYTATGQLVQWGTANVDGVGSRIVNFPRAFSSASSYGLNLTPIVASYGTYAMNITALNSVGFSCNMTLGNVGAPSLGFMWQAIGV
jgi:hypothetical protein